MVLALVLPRFGGAESAAGPGDTLRAPDAVEARESSAGRVAVETPAAQESPRNVTSAASAPAVTGAAWLDECLDESMSLAELRACLRADPRSASARELGACVCGPERIEGRWVPVVLADALASLDGARLLDFVAEFADAAACIDHHGDLLFKALAMLEESDPGEYERLLGSLDPAAALRSHASTVWARTLGYLAPDDARCREWTEAAVLGRFDVNREQLDVFLALAARCQDERRDWLSLARLALDSPALQANPESAGKLVETVLGDVQVDPGTALSLLDACLRDARLRHAAASAILRNESEHGFHGVDQAEWAPRWKAACDVLGEEESARLQEEQRRSLQQLESY